MEGAPVYNPLSSSNSYKQNTFISKNYIYDWKPKDVIREVLQNQFYGINSQIGKTNVKIIPKQTDKLNAF